MLHREQKLNRFKSEQAELGEQVISAKLTLETRKIVIEKLQHRNILSAMPNAS